MGTLGSHYHQFNEADLAAIHEPPDWIHRDLTPRPISSFQLAGKIAGPWGAGFIQKLCDAVALSNAVVGASGSDA
jgi:hypothetical protein